MTQDTAPRPVGKTATRAPRAIARRSKLAVSVESLEGRQLLSGFFTGPTPMRTIMGPSGMYLLSINGPGLERVRQVGHGAIAITLLGTTQASELDFSLTRALPHRTASALKIASIRVVSGQLGGIQAGGVADLLGPITPLNGNVNTLQFADLGSNAQIDVGGSLGSLGTTGSIALGPNGHVNVAGDLQQSLNVGQSLSITGGQISIGNNLAGSLSAGSVILSQGGRIVVGHDLTGTARINGDFVASSNGLFAVADNLGGLSVSRSLVLDSGGQIAVGNDLTGPITVNGAATVSNSGKLTVGRDATGGLSVTGNLALSGNGVVAVGRGLSSVTVNGDFTVTGAGSGLGVGGSLTSFTVNGAFVGKGTGSASPDLTVGLNLNQLNVLGGGADQGGLQFANIEVGKNLLGLNVPHGIFNSFITAGVLIDGGSSSTGGGNIGPDGPDAVYNSEIRAGVAINHLTLNGNVRSTFATNPNSTGYRTRIIAGETRGGQWLAGGLIDNFQITGQLIDAVVAASVAPNGGNGSYPASGYGANSSTVDASIPGDLGFNTYDKPAGTITGGTVGAPVIYPNYTELSYYNELRTGVKYDPTDPTIDDAILPGGSINPSFASARLPASSLIDPTAKLPLPTSSTVLGGVVSTKHGDEADFAGLFAADTRGVFIGGLPS